MSLFCIGWLLTFFKLLLAWCKCLHPSVNTLLSVLSLTFKVPRRWFPVRLCVLTVTWRCSCSDSGAWNHEQAAVVKLCRQGDTPTPPNCLQSDSTAGGNLGVCVCVFNSEQQAYSKFRQPQCLGDGLLAVFSGTNRLHDEAELYLRWRCWDQTVRRFPRDFTGLAVW